MAKRLEKVWEDIANEAIAQAELVDCSLEDFAAGLKDIENAIGERRYLADSEVDASGDVLNGIYDEENDDDGA